jgi:hypothetical protein
MTRTTRCRSGERIVVSGTFLLDSEARPPHTGDGMAKRWSG